MNSCVVYGCTSNTSTADSRVQYYYFPKHPLVAQQWLAACWQPEPIDIANAQICSIHFDSSCFSTEYKMDYLGNYTKVLKFDAIPNLYLPNTQQSIILKTADDPVSTDRINSGDIKDIMVFELQTVPLPVNNFVTLTTNQIADGCSTSQVLADNEKYKHVTNKTQLEHIKNANLILKRNCEEYQMVINQLKEKINRRREEVKLVNEEIRKISRHLDAARINNLSVAEQRNILSKVFSESQIKILSGKKKIYWSNDDMAMGYTIRQISNKRCYFYLSKKLNFPLPALSSIKRWSTLKKSELNGNLKKEESKFIEDVE
ncbi:hypothetical protein PPYR_04634 [Photinus pyralis]|uniref:THAP-type domain-containing protein n=1 Tax=Photinus pyralis TaxID=7054 RepID=A0A1Y1KMS1_PHOPY|nr:THAP domain-containing protein 1-like [Photinus pyralis]KAB0802448.1 hypothetical protein PPYR_04634 [Photinus pyralis]